MATYDHTIDNGDHDWWADTEDNRFNKTDTRILVGDYEGDEIYHSGLYFATGIPQGATINSASLYLEVIQTASSSLVWRIHTELVAAPTGPHTALADMTTALTRLSTAYIQRSGLSGLNTQKEYDVVDEIQEAVNQDGFNGNLIVIFTTISSNDLLAGFDTFENASTGTEPRLVIDYDEAAGGGGGAASIIRGKSTSQRCSVNLGMSLGGNT